MRRGTRNVDRWAGRSNLRRILQSSGGSRIRTTGRWCDRNPDTRVRNGAPVVNSALRANCSVHGPLSKSRRGRWRERQKRHVDGRTGCERRGAPRRSAGRRNYPNYSSCKEFPAPSVIPQCTRFEIRGRAHLAVVRAPRTYTRTHTGPPMP